MNIHVIASVNEGRSEDFSHKTVIVIDVLRATTTMLTALAHGAEAVIPTETVQQAKQLQTPDGKLGGERSCKKIPGFDFGNSPLEYTEAAIGNKTLVFTTTNGTRAIQKARKANHILIGAFVNASACAAKAAALDDEIVILCAGTQDVFALEDGLCAGLLADLIGRQCIARGRPQPAINDFGISMLHAYRSAAKELSDVLLRCANGKRLTKLGFEQDVLYCSKVDLFDISPSVFQGNLQLEAIGMSKRF